MLHVKARFGTAFLLTSLLAALSGTVNAQVDSDHSIKLIDGYSGESAVLSPGQSITMSGTYYTYTTGGEVTASTASYGSSGWTVTGGYSAPSSVDGPQMIAGLPITSGTTRFFGQGRRFISVSKTTPNTDPSGCAGKAAEPIVMSTGAKVETYTDFVLPGEMGLQYQRFYTSNYFNHLTAQAVWSDTFSYALDDTCQTNPTNGGACRQVMITRPNGSDLVFINTGTVSAPIYVEQSGGVATLVLNANSTYTLQDEDGTTQIYTSDALDANGVLHAFGAIQSIMDASGVGWTFSYPADGSQVITHTNGQTITKRFLNSSTMTVTDPAGHVFTYTLTGANDNFASVTYPGTPATTIGYQYGSSSNVNKLTEVDYNGVPYAYTTYASNGAYGTYGSANGTYYADGSQNTSLLYGTANNTPIVTVTNALGHTQVNTYGATVASNGDAVPALTSTSDNAVADCGATEHTRAYDANGNLSQTVDNNGNVHTYNYAANGQLQTETEASGTSQARTTDYVWDPNLQLNRLTSVTVEGWSRTVYTYNAQNRLASVAVTNLSSNGTANQTLTTSYNYTLYGNGMVQTLSVTHPSPSNSDTDVYTYDTLGNITSLANGLGQTTTYSNYNGLGEPGHVVGPNGDATDVVYDARGRVQTKTTYPNGTAATWQYTYDGFGLLSTLTTPDNEVTTWNRDAEMRVKTITHNDKDGTSTETFGYDANSDVTSHVVTRGGVTSVAENTLYDALGRVYQKQGQHGQTLTYGYDGNGNVLTVTDAVGHSTVNAYDHLDRLVQTTQSGGASPPMPSAAPTLSVPATSTNGSYTVSWSSVSGATSYLLQEAVNGGSWSNVQNSASTSWGASSQGDGSYGYRVQGCNVTGCGPWSSVGATTVLYPPGTPTLSVPATSNTGGYTVSWSSVGTATSYTLQEQVNGGAWTTVQSGGAASWSVTGKANNTYGYQVQACNGSGCSAWSAVSSVAVLLPPGGAPTLTAPSSNASGSYTVSWTSVATATSYTLQQQVNGGSWTTVQSSSAISWNASGESNGAYAYRVAACDAGGCSAWSSTSTTTVLLPPGSPPSVSSPSTNSTGSYTVSWSTITNATSYNLQEQVNGGGWTAVQSGSATSWSAAGKANGTYGYQAQSCNSGGCSAWSSVSTTTVLHPPGSAPALTVPGSSTTGSYTVSWTGVSTATSYTLQEQVNGGGWTTVQSTGATSWAASGHGNGTYGYQVQACNASGCGPWSSVGAVTVLLPPGSAPSLSVPGSNGNGSYTVSWSSVATATGYNLQEQVNGGGWTTVQSSSSTSWGTSGRGNGTYGYHVQACNASGCGPWSAVGSSTVLLPPGSAPSLSVPARNYTGSYTVTWGSVSTASSYTLQEQVNGGGWSTVQANGATSWSASGHANGTYGYHVIACNTGGCGPWSGIGSAVIIIPVPIAMNGQTYSGTRSGSSGVGNEGMGFDIVNGNTWEVYKTQVGNPHVVLASGAVPPGASAVQYTWNDAGVPPGDSNAGGSITNPAGSPVSISSNPSTQYTTGTFSLGSGDHGHQYNLRIDFYDVAGGNVSSSTCLLITEVVSTN